MGNRAIGRGYVRMEVRKVDSYVAYDGDHGRPFGGIRCETMTVCKPVDGLVLNHWVIYYATLLF